jgi:hypothetical protein
MLRGFSGSHLQPGKPQVLAARRAFIIDRTLPSAFICMRRNEDAATGGQVRRKIKCERVIAQ